MTRDRGSATAEAAVVLPALLAVTVLCVWAVASVAVHLQCLDAARTGARALARDEAPERVLAVVQEAAPGSARVRVLHLDGGLVAVEVTARVALPGPWPGDGPGLSVGGRAVAAQEGATG
ncbi:MAG: pilus assembly protein [Spirochaetaceae bacterium]|nr:pilus assembly protein [Spirochaetaceae bacterium]